MIKNVKLKPSILAQKVESYQKGYKNGKEEAYREAERDILGKIIDIIYEAKTSDLALFSIGKFMGERAIRKKDDPG